MDNLSKEKTIPGFKIITTGRVTILDVIWDEKFNEWRSPTQFDLSTKGRDVQGYVAVARRGN